MRGLRRIGLPFGVLAAALAAGGALPGTASAACAPGALVPALRDVTVTQGLNSYAVLARGKETLVRLYLSLPGCAVAGDAVTITDANLTVTVADAATNAVQSTTTIAATPAVAQPYPLLTNLFASPLFIGMAPSDPAFVVPGSVLAPAGDSGRLNVTFTPSVSYTGGTAPVTFAATTKTVERRTNALRILVVPLAAPLDVSSSQNIQNAISTLSRLYPVQDGTGSAGARVGPLTGTDGGIRWNLNAGIVDFAPLGIPLPFCGTSSNFALIKAQLAQFRTSWNAANPNAQADKVLGAINEANSNGYTVVGCAEGMASVNSPESWVRASAIAGATAGMEVSHTWGIVPFGRSNNAYHSLHKQADYAAADLHKGYNVTTRQQLADARSSMSFSPPGWTNDNVLLEPLDYANVLCQLGGAAAGGCAAAASGTTGTAVGVSAAIPDPAFNINAVTDGTLAGTKVEESFVARTYPTPPADPASPYALAQYGAGGALLRSDPVADSSLETTHSGTDDNDAHASTALISASIPLAAGTVDVKLLHGTTVLYDANNDGTPAVTTTTVVPGGGPSAPPGGTVGLGEHAVKTTPIPPKADVYFLSDTTGSMGPALDNVKANIASIIGGVDGGGIDARFGAGTYRDFPVCADSFVCSDYAFANNAGISDAPPPVGGVADPHGVEAAKAAVNGWAAAQGNDNPEAQLYALHQIATTPGFFRANSSPIVVWFGDNPGHDPICKSLFGGANDITQASVTDELKATKVRVIAVTVNSGESLGLDGDPNAYVDSSVYTCTPAGTAGQGTSIATATGGVFESAATPDQVSQAILAGLANLPVTVTPHADCAAGVSISFDPESRTVISGSDASFVETAHVASDASPGPHLCTITYNVGQAVDPALTRTVTIDVTSITGPHDLLTWTVTGAPAAKLKVDVVLNCSGVRNVLAVALTGTSFNTPIGCPGGTYEIVANDGFTQTPPATAGTVSIVTVAPPPVAAIASPAAGTTVGARDLVPLRGSGYDYAANAPIPPGGLHWLLDGSPAGTGPSVDLRGLAPGGHTITLVVTDSLGVTGQQSVAITSTDDADGDGIKLPDELRIAACAPPGSPPPDSDPRNGSLDYDHDGIPNRDDLNTPGGPCVAETLYQARGIFLPNPLYLSGIGPISAGAIVLPQRDLRQVIGSTIQIVSVNDIPVPGGIHALLWGAIGQIGGAIFPRAPLVSFLRAHNLANTTVALRGEGSAGSWKFFVIVDVKVVGP